MKTVKNFIESEVKYFPSYVSAFIPQDLIVPFENLHKENYRCIINRYDAVQEGQIIAVAENEGSDELNAVIHSPVPGTVTDIISCSLPNGKMGRAAKIHLSGSFSYLGKKIEEINWRKYYSEELIKIFSDKGIINTFEKPVSLSKQINVRKESSPKLLFLRLFDEDPSRVTEKFITENFKKEVIEGTKIIAKAFKADGIVIALQKKNTIDEAAFTNEDPALKLLYVNIKRYPCGFKPFFVNALRKEMKDETESVFAHPSIHNLFIDVQTALSVYEAVVFNKPVVERFIQVTGDCLNAAGMMKIRIGTTINEIAEQCGGFKRKPKKIIINGKISGFAISDLNTPVTKIVKSISFVSSSEVNVNQFTDCIRCGNCRNICPSDIYPDLIYRHTTGGKPVGKELMQTADLCNGCLLCNSVCPARIPLAQSIDLIKEKNND